MDQNAYDCRIITLKIGLSDSYYVVYDITLFGKMFFFSVIVTLLLQIAYIGKNLLFLISSLNRGLVWNNNRGSLNTNAIQAVNNTKQTEKKWKTSVFDCSRLPLLLSDYSLLAACFQFVLYC